MCSAPHDFAPRGSKHEVEEGARLAPAFDASGLITCVVTDADGGDVLMVAHMNAEALRRTIATGEGWFWSRSRQTLWRKGDTSGQVLHVVEMRVDCDQDAVWLRVRVGGDGGCCHTGRRTCFYRAVATGDGATPDQELRFVEQAPRG
ncbi:phosphoribosyl-AMP cyclohydrolase [Camelimonas abortus]|uniref:Phosphoribosyl-AMP cyclohydrolase n=1 Tax=Camelimonas abortus TaxID=1017184 RepID=A0ABV7LHE8_9HYPH